MISVAQCLPGILVLSCVAANIGMFLSVLLSEAVGRVKQPNSILLTCLLFSFDKMIAWFCLSMVFCELQGADDIIVGLASSVHVIDTIEFYEVLLAVSLPNTCFGASKYLL